MVVHERERACLCMHVNGQNVVIGLAARREKVHDSSGRSCSHGNETGQSGGQQVAAQATAASVSLGLDNDIGNCSFILACNVNIFLCNYPVKYLNLYQVHYSFKSVLYKLFDGVSMCQCSVRDCLRLPVCLHITWHGVRLRVIVFLYLQDATSSKKVNGWTFVELQPHPILDSFLVLNKREANEGKRDVSRGRVPMSAGGFRAKLVSSLDQYILSTITLSVILYH